MRWRKAAVVIVVLFVAGLIPIPYIAAPRWDVSVVTEDGKALPGVAVRLVYENYSAEGEGHEITLTTDENGHVLFPEQFQKSSLVRRMFHTLSSASAGVHASLESTLMCSRLTGRGTEEMPQTEST